MKLQHSIAIALLIAPTLTYAALGPIVITPSAYEQTREEASVPITVISQHTIENSGATSVSELLRGQAGLHISDIFGDGNQTKVDLRGFGPTATSNTLILLDGRRLNNSTDTAAPDLSTIDIDLVQQIEIIQGSAGVLYGNQAVGGVINIISKKPLNDYTNIKFGLGSYNNKKLSISNHQNIGKTQLTINASTLSSDNYRDHNDADKQHISIRAQRQHDTFKSYVEFEKTDDHLLTPGALLQTELDDSRTQALSFYKDDYFDTQTNVLRIGLDKAINSSKSFNLDISKRINDREFIQAFRPNAATKSTQDRETQTVAAKLLMTGTSSKTILGFNHEINDYKLVSSLGPQPLKQKLSDIYLSTDFFINSDSTVNVGVRNSNQDANNNSNDLNDSQTLVSLSYSWRKDGLKTYIRADQNFRFPTVEEHTNTGFGNPVGLSTQTGTSIELGGEYVSDKDRYRMSLYQINLKNEIAYDGTTFSNLNLNDTARKGMVFEAQHNWSHELNSHFSFTVLDAKITDGNYEGNSLPLVPERIVRLNTAYDVSKNTVFNIDYIYVDDQVLGGDFDNALSKLASYSVVNANINYTLKNWKFTFKVNNLLGELYSEQGNQFTDYSAYPTINNYPSFFTAPERNYWFSTQYKF